MLLVLIFVFGQVALLMGKRVRQVIDKCVLHAPISQP